MLVIWPAGCLLLGFPSYYHEIVCPELASVADLCLFSFCVFFCRFFVGFALAICVLVVPSSLVRESTRIYVVMLLP